MTAEISIIATRLFTKRLGPLAKVDFGPVLTSFFPSYTARMNVLRKTSPAAAIILTHSLTATRNRYDPSMLTGRQR